MSIHSQIHTNGLTHTPKYLHKHTTILSKHEYAHTSTSKQSDTRTRKQTCNEARTYTYTYTHTHEWKDKNFTGGNESKGGQAFTGVYRRKSNELKAHTNAHRHT